MNKTLIKLKHPPVFLSTAAVGGRKESEGPLAFAFSQICEDDRFGMDTWEKSESEMQRRALHFALSKAEMKEGEIDALFAGDLMNQCTGSAYGLLEYDIPFLGLYGACSTSVEGLLLASLCMQEGFGRCAVVTSSHFCSAERQFRLPIEYGGQRTPTAQWTVTGSGAFILDNDAAGEFSCAESCVRITEVLPGRSIDGGITDANNMGAAMAPAAVDSFTRYFEESGRSPEDFDLILTGDLGYEGSGILRELLRKRDIVLGDNYNDCGLLIYDREKQDVHAGGSGCGCAASVLAGYVIPKMESGGFRRVLAVATGALMSPSSVQQGQSIPGVAHLVCLECGGE
ncbi:MAG: stage V sporulation protein AD [Clostridia bacterium]|nr:stage V sporulation protein AD [Clostridia bacterium]